MKSKVHLSICLLGITAITVCTAFYFLYKLQNSLPITAHNIFGVLFCFVMGAGSAIIGYLSSIGKVNLNQPLQEPNPQWGKFRQAFNNPNYYGKVLHVFCLAAPFLIGIGVATDALRGF